MASANLLEKVTPGPWEVYGRLNVGSVDLKRGHVATFETEEDAALGALAYDHALWGSAVAAEVVVIFREPPSPVVVRLVSGLTTALERKRGYRDFPCALDAFGCPALTPELRAALRKAVAHV